MAEQEMDTSKSSDPRPAHQVPKIISSDALLGHMKYIFILHDGHSYQLRITKLGKLILTK